MQDNSGKIVTAI